MGFGSLRSAGRRTLCRAGAILDRDETLVLLEPAKHLDLLDLLAGSPATCTCAPSRRPARTSPTRSAAARRAVAIDETPRVLRSSETPNARKAYNYTRAAYERSRSRT
jgi:hypothetical protein